MAIASIILDPLTPSTLYVLGGSVAFALYKSTDAGETWTVIDSGPFYFSMLVIDPMSPSTLYAIRFGAGLSKSTDGGASWTATGFTQNSGSLTIDPRDSNILYVGTYKSLDGGWSWKALHAGFPTGRLVIDPGNSSTFYVMTDRGVLSRSTDAGARWTEINTGRRGLDIRQLVGSPVDPATIYAGGADGLFKSIDSGGNWRKQDLPFSAAAAAFNEPTGVRSLLINHKDPNILYVVTSRSGDCFFDENVLFKSTDGGAAWNNSISPKSSGCTYVGLMGMDPVDPNTLYFGGDWESYYALLKTTDGGENWNDTGLYQAGVDVLNVLAINPGSPATLYAGTKKGVFRSGDCGGKWNLSGLATTNVNVLAINPLQPEVLYASTTFGRGLFKSTDSGATWSPINKGLARVRETRASVNALILDPGQTGTLYLGTSGHGVFKSSDAGATWDPFNDGLTNLDVRVLMLTRGVSATVYAGTPGGVFKLAED